MKELQLAATEPTCPGACCAVFPLRREAVQRLGEDPDHFQGGPYIAAMIIPLEREAAIERYRSLGYGEFPDEPALTAGEWDLYTCRHWDPATRLCTAYDARPSMCRDYPYGQPCERGCGLCSGS